MAHIQMNSHRSNADGNSNTMFTRMRLRFSRSLRASSAEPVKVGYSVSAPKVVQLSGTRPRNTFVISGPPSVIFLRDGIQVSHPIGRTNLPFALLSVAFFIYGVPTALEFLAAQHLNPWIAVILPGDIVGCFWLAAVVKMRRTALLLYLALTASESCLYALGLVSSANLVWTTDLVPALFVAVMITRSNRRYS